MPRGNAGSGRWGSMCWEGSLEGAGLEQGLWGVDSGRKTRRFGDCGGPEAPEEEGAWETSGAQRGFLPAESGESGVATASPSLSTLNEADAPSRALFEEPPWEPPR